MGGRRSLQGTWISFLAFRFMIPMQRGKKKRAPLDQSTSNNLHVKLTAILDSVCFTKGSGHMFEFLNGLLESIGAQTEELNYYYYYPIPCLCHFLSVSFLSSVFFLFSRFRSVKWSLWYPLYWPFLRYLCMIAYVREFTLRIARIVSLESHLRSHIFFRCGGWGF